MPPPDKRLTTSSSGRTQKFAYGHLLARALSASAIGGSLLFLSWIAEHVFMEARAAERLELQISALFVTGELANANAWLIKYKEERRRIPPDPEYLANAARNFVVYASNALWRGDVALAETDPDRNRLLDSHEDLVRTMDARIAAGELGPLVAEAERFVTRLSMEGPLAKARVRDRFIAIATNEWRARRVFLTLYIAGALMVGWGYVTGGRGAVTG